MPDKKEEVLDTSNENVEEVRDFLFEILVLGEYLNINSEFYKSSILRLTARKINITD